MIGRVIVLVSGLATAAGTGAQALAPYRVDGDAIDAPLAGLRQTLGSLQRRFRSCLSGIRAEMLPYGAAEYLDPELYVAWRAEGLAIETPGVRR